MEKMDKDEIMLVNHGIPLQKNLYHKGTESNA